MPHPFLIENNEVAALAPAQLTELVNRLLRTECRAIGLASNDVETTLRENDPDGGADAAIRRCHVQNVFVPQGLSFWQFKATQSLPTKTELLAEVRKPFPAECFASSGTYVFVVKQDLNSLRKQSFESTLEEVIKEAYGGGKFRVYCAGQLADWCDRHPWARFYFPRRAFSGLQQLSDLRRLRGFSIKYQADDKRVEQITQLRALAEPDSAVHAIRLFGHSGTGKTRTTLEAFHEIADTVLYCDNGTVDPTLLDWISKSGDSNAILVIDECSAAEADGLEKWTETTEGRLRVVAVGHDEGFTTNRLKLAPLQEPEIRNLLAEYPLQPEQIYWVARVAHGYPRMAIVVAEAIASGEVTAGDISTNPGVTGILRKLIPDEQERSALRALACVRRVGWDGDVSEDAAVIAGLIGWNEASLRNAAISLINKGFLQRQGRYVYVTPHILALAFAAEAWRNLSSQVLEISVRLSDPSSAASRLGELEGLPEASHVVEEVMGPEGTFRNLATLNTPEGASLFHTLAPVARKASATRLRALMEDESDETLREFMTGRRSVVFALEMLARNEESFEDAVIVLRKLARAENETWANNATGVFSDLFSTFLAGTSVPAIKRLDWLETYVEEGDSSDAALAGLALGKALDMSGFGPLVVLGDRVDVPRWAPTNQQEERAARLRALALLVRLIERHPQNHEATRTLLNSTRGLVALGLGAEVADALTRADLVADDGIRRRALEALEEILQADGLHLAEDQREQFERLKASLFSDSPQGRLQRFVGRHTHQDWQRSAGLAELSQRAANCADEIVSFNPADFESELHWLASGEAEFAWVFGQRLGVLDSEQRWFAALAVAVAGQVDLRVFGAYVAGHRTSGRTDWIEKALDQWVARGLHPDLVFEADRAAPTNPRFKRIAPLVASGRVPSSSLYQLAWGGWPDQLSDAELNMLLSLLLAEKSPFLTEAAFGVIDRIIELHGELSDQLMVQAWAVLEQNLEEGSARPMLPFYWKRLASHLLPRGPERVAKAAIARIAAGGDDALTVLTEAAKLAPENVWERLAERIEADLILAHRLGWHDESELLDAFPHAVLLAWAEKSADRPKRLAVLVKPRDSLGELPRQLISKYGHDGPVASALVANFMSGTYRGGHAAWLRAKLQIVEGWRSDSDPHVRKWAQRLADSIRGEIPGAELEEAERGY